MPRLNPPRKPLPVGQVPMLKLSGSEVRLERTNNWVKDLQAIEEERVREKTTRLRNARLGAPDQKQD
jgi:hypothetical protein